MKRANSLNVLNVGMKESQETTRVRTKQDLGNVSTVRNTIIGGVNDLISITI